jgi:O-antigen ligase
MGLVAALGTILTAAAMIYGFGGSYDILGATRAYWEQPWQSSIRLTELILPFLYSAFIFGRHHISKYWLMCVLLVVCLLGVVLTFSRQSWLVSLFGILCVSAFRLRKKLLIPVTLCIPLVILLIAWAPGSIKSVTQFYNPDEVYGLDRVYFYLTGLQLFVAHPLLGVGAGNYQFFDRIYAEVSAGGISHNQFITVAAETGILGLLMLFWFVAKLLKIPHRYHLWTGNRSDSLYWVKVAGAVFLLAWISECFFQEAFFVTAAAGGGTKVMTATVFPWILLGVLFAVFNLAQAREER